MSSEPNVAYTGTSQDLNVNMTNPVMKNGGDMTFSTSGMDMLLYPDPVINNNYDGTGFDNYYPAMPISTPYSYHMSPQEATLELQRLSSAESSVQMLDQQYQSRATVSPQDLMLDDWQQQGSAPPSSLIPELTPNSVALSSPGMADDMDYPLFAATTTGIEGSLFAGNAVASVKEKTSANRVTKSSATKKRSSNAPIEFDPNDPIDVKRAKNTGAARKSRQKKQTYLQGLEAQVKELQAALAASKAENDRLRALNGSSPRPVTPAAFVAQEVVQGEETPEEEDDELDYLFEESAADALRDYIA